MRGTEEKQRMTVEELLDDDAEVEQLKKTLKAQRQKRKKALIENVRDAHEDEAVEDDGTATRGQRSLPPLNISSAKSSFAESSMRERLREKLKAGRSKAESILQQESPAVSPRSLNRSRLTDTSTRFNEEQDVIPLQKAKDVEAQLSSRVRFRDAVKTIQKKTHVPDGFPTAEEAFNFFTFNFDPEPEADNVQDQKTSEEPKKKEDTGESSSKADQDQAEEGEEEMGEEESLVPDNDLFLIDQTARDFIELTAAEYEGYHSRLQKERELFFTPSFRQVPSSQKVPENMQPRYLEDEGLYIGERPKVSRTNQNLLENRILQQDEGKNWFGDDGNVLALPNPIKASPTRPPIFSLHEGIDPALETIYIKAVPSKKSRQYMVESGGLQGDFQLDIDISGIVFTHHQLFSREHVLASKLSQLYDQYLGRKQKNLSNLLSDKLHALRNAVQNISTGGAAHISTTVAEQSINEYKMEIKQTRKYRDAEQERDRFLLKSLIRVWKEIKSLRDFQKFTNTPVKLYLRKYVVMAYDYDPSPDKTHFRCWKFEELGIRIIEKSMCLKWNVT